MNYIKEKSVNVRFHYIHITSSRTRHILEIDKRDLNKLIREIKMRGLSVRVADRVKNLLWIDNPNPCTMCRLINQLDVILVSIKLSQDFDPVYKVLVSSARQLSRLRSLLESSGVVHEIKDQRILSNSYDLTPRQLQALILAYEYGYFDYPKRITLSDLSKILNVKQSTIDEILRRGVKKIIKYYLETRE